MAGHHSSAARSPVSRRVIARNAAASSVRVERRDLAIPVAANRRFGRSDPCGASETEAYLRNTRSLRLSFQECVDAYRFRDTELIEVPPEMLVDHLIDKVRLLLVEHAP